MSRRGAHSNPGDARRKQRDLTVRGYRWSLVLGFVLFPAPVFALLITLSFESVPGSVPLTGAGSNNATLELRQRVRVRAVERRA